MILAKHIVYRFRGNLTYDFIENQILTGEFHSEALEAERIKDLEGLTLANFDKQFMANIRHRQNDQGLGFKHTLMFSLNDHFS